MNIYYKNQLIYNLFILLFTSLSLINCDRIKFKIYNSIESNYFCFRRLNATQQIGCNSKEGGNVGVVYIIIDENDMKYVLHSGQHNPYIAVIQPKFFNLENMNRFKSVSNRISGVVVIDDHSESGQSFEYSADSSCPNENFDLYVNDSRYSHCAQQLWNIPNGKNNTGLMFNDWPFPIFFIKNQTSIEEIKKCFKSFGGPDWPLCAIQLVAPMNAAKDSLTCMRRSHLQKNSYFALNPSLFCDPLGGTNIFNTLIETSKSDSIKNNSVIVLASRLDSFSMFDQISPGADSAISSLVTLLTVAHTLNKPWIKNNIKDKNVLFALFDGEAFDYIGSGRTVYDMTVGKFPVDPKNDVNRSQIRIEHFSHFIELNQLGFHANDSQQKLWIHKNINPTTNLTKLEEIIKNNAKKTDLDIESVADGAPLPPSSLQSFLKENNKLVGIVIANHEKEFKNKFYNSLFDDINNLNISDSRVTKQLTNIATVVSKSIHELLTGNSNDSITADETLVYNLLDCYLNDSSCDLFKYVVSPDYEFPNDKSDPYPTYVGVHNSMASITSRTYTYLLLSYLTGEIENLTKAQCTDANKHDKLYHYNWMASPSMNGTCVKSQALTTTALSPAFLNDEIVNSSIYSTWTESQWRVSSARLFIRPSPLEQWLTLIAGLIILCVSFFVVYFVDKKSSILFESCDDIIPEQTLTVGC